jgi:putative ABC transport system permease protein
LKDVGDSAAALKTAYATLQAAGPVVSRDDTGSLAGRMGSMRAMMGMGGNRSVDTGERWTGTRFAVSGIEDLMAPLLTLVDTLDIISFGIFVLLLAIIMVGMLNSYRMVMIERTAEIGTMRAIGVQRRGIRDIFLVEAVSLTALGAAAGFLAALALMGLASLFNFGSETFFSLFLTQGHLRFFIDPAGTLRNFLILCAMSFAAVYLPARAASRLLPAQALRATY